MLNLKKLLNVIALCWMLVPLSSWAEPSENILNEKSDIYAKKREAHPEYIKSRMPADGEYFKFFRPALWWRVNKISLNWDLDTELFEEFLQQQASTEREEYRRCFENGLTTESTRITSEENRENVTFSLGCVDRVFTGADQSYSSVDQKIQAMTNFSSRLEAEAKSSENQADKIKKLEARKILKNPHIIVEVDFENNSRMNVFMKDFSIPVFGDGEWLGDANVVSGQVLPPREEVCIPWSFRCELNNINSIRNCGGRLSVDVRRSKGTLVMEDGNDVFNNVIKDDRCLYISDGALTGVLYFRDDRMPHTVRDFIRVLNKQWRSSKDALEFNENSPKNLVSKDGTSWKLYSIPTREEIFLDDEFPMGGDIALVGNENQRDEAIVDEFLRNANGRSAQEVLGLLNAFLIGNKDNPFREKAENCVLEIVNDYFETLISKNWTGTKNNYRAVENVCKSVQGTQSKIIQNSELFRFSKSYVEWLDSYSRTVQVHAIRGEHVDRGDRYVATIRCNGHKLSFDADTSTGRICSVLLKSPWEELVFEYTTKKRATIGKAGKSRKHWKTYKNVGEIRKGASKKERERQLNITFSPLDGTTIFDLWAGR